MTLWIAAALVTAAPPPPPAPPPFTAQVSSEARFLASRVSDEFERCGAARTNSNGRYVEAMGTARHSTQWSRATLAMSNALTVCRDLRQALRAQKDFLLSVIETGSKEDIEAARVRLGSVLSELEALENYFRTEGPRYREQVNMGWGNPHCIQSPLTGFEPPRASANQKSKDSSRSN